MRASLRTFFEVNRYYVAIAALNALAEQGEIESKVVQQAIKKYNIDPEKPNPIKV
jgi:pyruvate dehydrogenase E1 component